MNKIVQTIISVIGGIIATAAKQYGVLLIFMVAAIAIDVFTGLAKAKKTGVGWSSQKGTEGFYKKLSYLIAFAFGILLDCFIPYLLKYISIVLPFNMPFTLIIVCYIVLNECISIAENLYSINPNTLPGWIINVLTASKQKLEELNGVDSSNTSNSVNKEE